MSDWVLLHAKRHRGWPWPAESYGLLSMYGEDGWCRSCAIPPQEQTGPLTLQRRGLTVTGAWIPNWQFDTLCMEKSVAAAASAKFRLDLRAVEWPRRESTEAMQVVIPSVGPNWFDPAELTRLGMARGEGYAGADCPECGKWKWIPPATDARPLVLAHASWESHDVIASPEWFGQRMSAFRKVLVRRELARLLVTASPKDFSIEEARWAE